MAKNDSLNWEVSVGVTFASFMSAVALFFTGAVIAQYQNFGPTIKIPILFLVVSTFSFIFSASIYSNAGIEVTNDRLDTVHKYLIYANNIFEFLGLHLLVLATPLVIGAITADDFLRITTMAVALICLTLYSFSSFSILHKEVMNKANKALIIFFLIIFSATLYSMQFTTSAIGQLLYDTLGSIVLIFNIVLVIYFNKRSQQYKVT